MENNMLLVLAKGRLLLADQGFGSMKKILSVILSTWEWVEKSCSRDFDQGVTLNLCTCSASGPIKFSSRILISVKGPKKVSISDTVTLGVEWVFSVSEALVQIVLQAVMFAQDENYVVGFSIERYWSNLLIWTHLIFCKCVLTCVAGQGKGFCRTPKLAKGTWVQKSYPIRSETHPPERLSNKAFEKGHIARPCFKAESYERSAIPDCVNIANQLRTNVKQVAGKDRQSAVRSAVSAALNNRRRNHMTTLAVGEHWEKKYLDSRNVALDNRKLVLTEELFHYALDTLDACCFRSIVSD